MNLNQMKKAYKEHKRFIRKLIKEVVKFKETETLICELKNMISSIEDGTYHVRENMLKDGYQIFVPLDNKITVMVRVKGGKIKYLKSHKSRSQALQKLRRA